MKLCDKCPKFVRGLVGLGAALTGTDRAPVNVTVERRAVCQECPEAGRKRGRAVTCGACDCFLWAKTRLASQSCPRGYWSRHGR